jgi:putative transposase
MTNRSIFDAGGAAHFVTSLCFKRRRLLDDDRCKGIVIHVLASQLSKQNGLCQGFVVMPDHVHALVWFPEQGQLSYFMKQWKQRSSILIKKLLASKLTRYAETIGLTDPVWQRHYHAFGVISEEKLLEKLRYMHNNPVKKGLAHIPVIWPYSSARHYELGKPVGVAIAWPVR